jgi:hypothetical protein
MKRNDNNDNRYSRYNLCNPEGILLYAKSFLLVCKNNKFLKDEEADLLSEFIDNQEKEYEILSLEKKTIRNFFLSQKNIFASLTIALTILVALIKAFDFIFKGTSLLSAIDNPSMFYRAAIVYGCFMLAFLSHRLYIDYAIMNGKFNRKPKRKNLLNQNSNINKGELSKLYRLRIFLIKNTVQLHTNWFVFMLMVVIIAIVSFLWWRLFLFLIY